MNFINSFEHRLFDKYGILMSFENLAEVLKRSKNSLRITLQQDNDVSRRFNPARIKVGRRVYFNTEKVEQALYSADKDSMDNSV